MESYIRNKVKAAPYVYSQLPSQKGKNYKI